MSDILCDTLSILTAKEAWLEKKTKQINNDYGLFLKLYYKYIQS